MSKPDLDLPITSKAATPEYKSGWDLIWGKKDDSNRPSDSVPDGEDGLRDNSAADSGT